MLEVGNQSSIYEAYQENKYPLYLGVKNLFDKSDIETGKYYKTSVIDTSSNWAISQVKVQPNTNYYLSGNNYNNNTAKIVLLDSSKNILSSVGGYYETHLITTSSTTAYIGLSISLNADGNDLNTIQLEKGSKANSYSEYGKEPIEYCGIGDNKNKFIRTSGKNLFDKDNANILNAYIQLSTGKIISSNGDVTIYIKCNPNTQYTISKKVDLTKNRFRFGSSNSTPTIDSYCNNVVGDAVSIDNLSSYTYTSSNDAKYLLVQCWVSGGSYTEQQILDSIQIEEGNQATEYNPFGINEWWYKKAINKIVLDGSESYTSMSAVDNNYMFYTSSKQIPIDNYSTNYKTNYFTTNTASSGSSTIGSYVYNSTLRMRVPSTIATNGSDFQTWLSTHNTEIYYVLATPTYTKITDYTLLSQLEAIYNAISMQGVTNILQENNDLPFNIDASAIKEYE